MRGTLKGEKPSPRVVYRFGEQNHAVKEFLRHRRLIKRIYRSAYISVHLNLSLSISKSISQFFSLTVRDGCDVCLGRDNLSLLARILGYRQHCVGKHV